MMLMTAQLLLPMMIPNHIDYLKLLRTHVS